MNTPLRATICIWAAASAFAGGAAGQAADLAVETAAAREWLAKPAAVELIEAYGPAAEITMRRYVEPRPLRAWIARIDLRAPGVRLALTQPAEFGGEDAKYETRCANTLEFARQRGVQLAVNTSAFAPFRGQVGAPMDVVGLGAVRGRKYSEVDERFGAMYIARDGRVSLKGPPLPERDLWHAIAGFRMLLDDGKVAVTEAEAATKFGGLNPRTAAGVDREGRTLWLVVADGRRAEHSMGLTLVELAALFESLGAWDALNLDGGGSSTIVMEYVNGTHGVLNMPSGGDPPGDLRQVACNLGLYLPGRGAKAGEPRTLRDAAIEFASSKRGGGYMWKGDGVSGDVVYDGRPVLRANPAGTYCCGATFEAFLHAYCRVRLGRENLPSAGRWFEDWPAERFAAMQQGWYGTDSASESALIPAELRRDIRERQSTNVLAWTGLAEPVSEYRLLERGDFVQFWRKSGSGHSVIFWGRDFDEVGRERLWYWSSQGRPRYAYAVEAGGEAEKLPGYGLNWEYVGDEIDAARISGARLKGGKK